MTSVTRRALGGAAVLAALAWPAQSQEVVPTLPPSIRVTAEAIVSAKPDRVQIDVGVVTQAPQSHTAAEQNARELSSVLAALRKALGANAEIKTISYSLSPNFRYPQEGGDPTVTGYTAMNIVRVTLDELDRIGAAIDAAAKAGANQVQRIQFTLKDEQAARAQALREATLKAKGEAETLASALGVKITRVLSVVDNGPIAIPMQEAMLSRADSAGAPTPIQAGTIEIRANVSLTFEIAGR